MFKLTGQICTTNQQGNALAQTVSDSSKTSTLNRYLVSTVTGFLYFLDINLIVGSPTKHLSGITVKKSHTTHRTFCFLNFQRFLTLFLIFLKLAAIRLTFVLLKKTQNVSLLEYPLYPLSTSQDTCLRTTAKRLNVDPIVCCFTELHFKRLDF